MLPTYDELRVRLDVRTEDATTGQIEAICPSHHDNAPSLSLGRGADGKALITCHAGCEPSEVVAALGVGRERQRAIVRRRPLATATRVDRAVVPAPLDDQTLPAVQHRRLMRSRRTSSLYRFLVEDAGLTDATLRQFSVGADGDRITFPVRVDGEWRNIRRYQPGAEPGHKMRNVKGHGGAVLYPSEVLDAEGVPVLLCEGERDALLANQNASGAYVAVSGTGGAETVPRDLSRLADREVFIAYDCDRAGERGARKVAAALDGIAAAVYVIDLTELGLPADSKEDVSDYFLRRGGSREALTGEMERLRGLASRPARPRLHLGGSFALDSPDQSPALWGEGERVLWAEGEGFLLVGGDGVGKSTIAQQLVLARLGLRDEFLGLPVERATGRVLYLAMDRPRQIRRSLARMVSESDRATLDAGLVAWEGPLPFDPTLEPRELADWIEQDLGGGFSDVVADSMKDLAPGLSEDKIGSAINLAMQEVLARGMQWLGLHHNRKPAADRSAEYGIADVYGSRWLTAGMGSVVLVLGEAGGSSVELRHVKQPAAPVGPLLVAHDHAAGSSTVRRVRTNVLGALQESPGRELTTRQIAEAVYGVFDDATRKRTQRELERLNVEHPEVHKAANGRGGSGGSAGARWVFAPDSQSPGQRS